MVWGSFRVWVGVVFGSGLGWGSFRAGFFGSGLARGHINLEVGVMIEDEMIGEEVDHVTEIEEMTEDIMMAMIDVEDMMIDEGMILICYKKFVCEWF